MCLGVPGRILEVRPDATGMTMGRVSFGGIEKEVCLAYVPEAHEGDYVLVHVGFALSRIDEKEAQEVFRFLEETGELAEFGPAPGEGPPEPPRD
jgi:hydrogenase expression/formation protein HypC